MLVDDCPLTVLMAEDNPADVDFFAEAVETAGLTLRTHVVGTGQDALRFLRRSDTFAESPRPDVVILDLNLPIKTGRDVLAEMVADPNLQQIPVVVLTTSKSESEVASGYTPGRCIYFAKTAEFMELVDIARQIVAFARARATAQE